MNLAKRQILGLHQRRIPSLPRLWMATCICVSGRKTLRSSHSNGEDLLDRAVAHKVSLIALQEINIGEQALPSVINLAKRKGWQMAARERERERERGRERERERVSESTRD